MNNLLNDLLDAGRIETGTLSVTPVLASLVDQARNTFLSRGSKHTIHIDLAPDLPRMMADRERIFQVLNNLFCRAEGQVFSRGTWITNVGGSSCLKRHRFRLKIGDWYGNICSN